jgi:hypothetical protein
LEASGYTGRPTDFRRLLRILDNDLRLIRPSEDQDSHENTPLGAYQLTHDYLVPSLREWLTRKQRETPKGRAELKLADLAKVWASNREVRQLPTIIEWFNIHRWTERRKWIPIERSMMLHANKYYLSRFSIVCSLLMVMFASAALLKLRSDYHRLDETASTMVKNIESFDIEGVQKRLSDIRSLGDTLKNKLLEAIRNSPEGSDKRLNYNLALLGNHKPAIDELARSLPKVDSKQISILIEALRPYRADLIELFWSQVQEQTPQGDSAGLLQIASALAKYDTDSNRWDTICEKVVGKLVQENPLVVGDWTEALKPAKKHLIPALIKVFDKGNDASTPRAVELATEILFQYVDDHKTTHELVMLSQPREFAKFFPKYEIAKQSVEKLLRHRFDPNAPVYFTMIAFPAVTQRTKQADGIELTEVFGPIAVCDRETTWRQFSPFDNDRYRNLKGLEYNKVFELDEPVVGVTWFDAVDYCNKLVEVRMGDASYQCYESAGDSNGRKANQVGLEPIDARHLERTWHPNRPGFRLLTELEWEYVARCGMDTPYCFGSSEDLLPEYGWFQVNANRQLHKVGMLRPSIGGLFDIHGNVWEWTNDWYTERSVRALRSGSFEFDASICTTGYREQGAPTVTRANRGFRIGIGPDRTQAAGTVCESIRVKFGIGQRTKVRFVMSEEHNNRFLAHPPTEPPFF